MAEVMADVLSSWNNVDTLNWPDRQIAKGSDCIAVNIHFDDLILCISLVTPRSNYSRNDSISKKGTYLFFYHDCLNTDKIVKPAKH